MTIDTKYDDRIRLEALLVVLSNLHRVAVYRRVLASDAPGATAPLTEEPASADIAAVETILLRFGQRLRPSRQDVILLDPILDRLAPQIRQYVAADLTEGPLTRAAVVAGDVAADGCLHRARQRMGRVHGSFELVDLEARRTSEILEAEAWSASVVDSARSGDVPQEQQDAISVRLQWILGRRDHLLGQIGAVRGALEERPISESAEDDEAADGSEERYGIPFMLRHQSIATGLARWMLSATTVDGEWESMVLELKPQHDEMAFRVTARVRGVEGGQSGVMQPGTEVGDSAVELHEIGNRWNSMRIEVTADGWPDPTYDMTTSFNHDEPAPDFDVVEETGFRSRVKSLFRRRST